MSDDDGSDSAAVAGCKLIDKQAAFGTLIQASLALMGVIALLTKRWLEHPRRPWNVWLLDVSKQAMSMTCAHFAGVVNAVILSRVTTGGDECSWYFISFTVDTTLGVALAVIAMRLVAKLANKYRWDSLRESGQYGELPAGCTLNFGGRAYKIWARQMAVWCVVTVVARIICGLVMFASSLPLAVISSAIANVFVGRPHLFLALVMLGCPVGMNIIQVCIQDNVLRLSAHYPDEIR
jgi:hypothetical protein|eukprot:SAG25_NODE_449_length_7908_cov_17.677039_2_plen_236_part_00